MSCARNRKREGIPPTLSTHAILLFLLVPSIKKIYMYAYLVDLIIDLLLE